MAGPASALQNGVSFLDDPDLFDTARKHLEESAVSLNQRLEFFRLLLGRRSARQIGWETIRRITMNFMSDDRPVNLMWPSRHMPTITDDSPAVIRSMLCLLLVSEEILARGGDVTIESFDDQQLTMLICGSSVDLESEGLGIISGMKGKVDVSPRSAPAAWVAACCTEGLINVDVDINPTFVANSSTDWGVRITLKR